ncbi:TolB family protein [Frateuria sp. GZRe14]|uniref:TolB family protein n=1 Tax=Frateuria sp. GZRe14 TaxID=3351534 RepID=UPI003EDC5AB7
MKTNKLAGSICALLLTALGASSAFAQSSSASILFTRTLYRAVDGTHGSQLYRVRPSGSDLALLMPVTYGTDITASSWSPTGASAVFEVRNSDGTQLYVVDRQGSSPRQITSGASRPEQPLWAPNSGTIAYVATNRLIQCLGTVRADGTNQHIVFCPPTQPGTALNISLSIARWTADGKSVLVASGAEQGGLEPEKWYSNVYRVNVSTGAAVALANQVFDSDQIRKLAISPDGTRGVYDGNPLYSIDFASNTVTALPVGGYDPVYAPDGRKVAFLRNETNGSPYYSNVYLIHPDGSHLRKLTSDANALLTYTAIADWSWDSTRLLVDQVGDDRWLHMIDLRDNTARNVTKGTAGEHAWFHP